MINCIILTRGESDFSPEAMDGYAILPIETFRAMGGQEHPAYLAGLANAHEAGEEITGDDAAP